MKTRILIILIMTAAACIAIWTVAEAMTAQMENAIKMHQRSGAAVIIPRTFWDI